MIYKKKILIVDDIPKNIQILGNLLSGINFQIAYAQSGEQALEVIKHQDFDLILLDIMMPGINGFEVCKKLKNNKKTKEIPIIFLTAKADMESIIKGFEAGGQDYITKPFNSAELIARVNTHLLIREQKQTLTELNQNLESKVKERTRQLEEAYKRLNNLEKAKTDFLAIISHELRTPVNGLIGLTSLFEQTDLTSEQKEYLEYLNEVSDRLKRFSEIALLITQLKVKKNKTDLLPTAVKYMVESVVEDFEEKSKNEKLKIELHNVSDNVMIKAASDLISQAINLILSNCEKFGKHESPIELTVKATEENVKISCIDDGPGFKKDALDSIFELFANGDLSHYEGAGLSLAAVKLIMEMHEGDLKVENRKNKNGACVTMIFPRIKNIKIQYH